MSVTQTASAAQRRRLYYAAPLLFYGFLASLGLHEEGLLGVSHLLFLVVISVLQMVKPTLIGWAALALPIVAYVPMLFLSASTPNRELLIFLALAVTVACALWVCRPWRSPAVRS